MAAYKKKSFTSFKFKKKRAQRRVRRDGQISADRNKSLGGGPRSISFTMPYQSPYKSPTFARGISSSTVGMSLVPFAAKDRFINTRLQVISAMDQFKHYSLEELRYFDGRVLEITAGFGLQTIKRHQQFIFPKGTEVATFSGGKWTLTTNHICITAIERYKDFSLEELRYADLVEQQLVKLDHESHTYLNRKPTQTDTSCWPYHVKGFPFGLTGVEEKTTVNQKLFDDKTRQNQAIAEKSSDDVVGYSPKHYDVTNSANNNNRSDEAEHETKNATDASFFVSVKSASLEKVESDHVLSRIKSMFLDLIENYDSAEITSEFDQKSTASISGSETVILPKHSSADCSTNVFRCNSLSSPDGARNITNDKPDLRSRVFAIGTPFAFKYVPNFGEATTRSTDKTFKMKSSSPATTWITPSLYNPTSTPTHVPVTSVQCQTALLDNSCDISPTAPNVQVKAKGTYAKETKTPTKDKFKVNKDSPAKVTDEVNVDDVKIEDVAAETTPIAQSDSPAPSDTPPSRITPTIQVEEVKDEAAPENDVPKEQTTRTPSPLSDRNQSPSSDLGVELEIFEAQPSPARHQEEERERLEEERQRRKEEEAMRLSSEARIREEERLQRAIETEERRRRKKAERQEQDRVARKESDGKAKEEAERREKEMSERAKREEEERTERRNRLEMIMKRVKTDTPTTTPERARNPDVVELFVGGTHRYTTLRATVTQAKAGDLAEMFLGKEPLRVMKDGAYFLDTDGESFKLIIEYLRDGRLPDMDADSMKGTLRSEELLLKSSQTARKYGLLEYLHEIDQYGPIQRFKELEANKDIVEFYCKQILWALNKNDLEQNGKFAILLKSTNSTQIAASCCEHVCQFAPVDTVVHLTRKFSLQILRVLCQRLRFLGYNVAANEESCLFKCSKHEDGDTDKKECASRRHLLMWFVWLKKCSNPHE